MTHDPIEIRHLRYFLAVAEAGNFSRAADRLGVSQPNVSQQLRDLEEALRVGLFQRRGKRILLTSAGLIFQEHARSILRQMEAFLQELNIEPGQMRGRGAGPRGSGAGEGRGPRGPVTEGRGPGGPGKGYGPGYGPGPRGGAAPQN